MNKYVLQRMMYGNKLVRAKNEDVFGYRAWEIKSRLNDVYIMLIWENDFTWYKEGTHAKTL